MGVPLVCNLGSSFSLCRTKSGRFLFCERPTFLLTREWYMHPNGQLPAYEWNFSDVNPPVHAWATFRVFKIDEKKHGKPDLYFLESVFQKLLLNFTWWVNRKDMNGNNIFGGGSLVWIILVLSTEYGISQRGTPGAS